MPNKFINPQSSTAGKDRKNNSKGKAATYGPEKTGSVPGLPGKSQSRDRSLGTPKVKIHPKSEGI